MEININLTTLSKKIKIDGIIVLILIIATLLRFYKIGFQGAWLDEIHTLKESDKLLSFSELHQMIMTREGTPHFYFITVRFFSELFGSSIVAARSVSALGGVLAVFFIYKLGKELYNKNTGYMAALILTFNVFHVAYSQEARSYSLFVLFIIISYYFLITFIKTQNIKSAILLGLFSGLITNTHLIGLLNVVAIYLVLLIGLFMQDNKNRKSFFFKSILSGIITLLIFSPVYQMLIVMTKFKDFWVAPASYEGIKRVFIDLSGNSFPLFIITLLFLVFFIFKVVRNYKKQNINSNLNLSFITLFIWLFFCTTFLIVKSYLGSSLILQRYFIGVLPALILISAIGIELITSSIIKKTSFLIILTLLIVSIFTPENYYNTITKAQFGKTCNEVIKNNPNNEKIFSNWGWLLSYYLDHENTNKNVMEMNLQSTINSMMINAIPIESFWYIDGNSRPYSLSSEHEQFLNEHFTLDTSIENQDSWAKHYNIKLNLVSQKLNIDNFGMKDFSPKVIDGSGNMIFFENSSVMSSKVGLASGKYKLLIYGNSLPEKPIQGINAHLNIKMNGISIGDLNLSEKPSQNENALEFDIKQEQTVSFELIFDNDFAQDDQDRNAIITSIKIVKI